MKIAETSRMICNKSFYCVYASGMRRTSQSTFSSRVPSRLCLRHPPIGWSTVIQTDIHNCSKNSAVLLNIHEASAPDKFCSRISKKTCHCGLDLFCVGRCLLNVFLAAVQNDNESRDTQIFSAGCKHNATIWSE